MTDAAVRPLPHHDGSPLHVSDVAPALGDTVRVRLRVPVGHGPVGHGPVGHGSLEAVRVRSNPDHEPHWDEARLLGTAGGWDWWEAEVTVENPRHGYRWLLVHAPDAAEGPAGRRRVEWLNQAGLYETEPLDSEDFALLAYAPPPEWAPSTVMYQIFPDRFARSAAAGERPVPEWAIPAAWDEPVDPVMPGRSQQFYGGDLDGIVDRLDHLVELGVNMIYLTPIFPGGSNHRYDASSFTEVDPLLGGGAALVRLVTAAHERGIRVIGDLTSNHSGNRHEWFQAAHGHPDAAESDFYYFTNPEHTEYVSWLGTPTLPKFNWNSAELRRRFIEGPDSVVAQWLKPPYALDGWRIDVANMTGRVLDEDLNAEVRQIIRQTMIEVNPDTILLAESTNDATSDFQGDGWHGAMSYPGFTRPLWGWLSEFSGESRVESDGTVHAEPWFFGQPIGGIPSYTARQFVEMTVRFTAGLPWRVRLAGMLPLDTHDTARFRTHAAPGAVPIAVGLSMTLPGIPVVFAGDEFGLVGADGEESRTPMPWHVLASGQPDTLALYRELIALRRSHPVLSTGGLRWLHVDDETIVFVRESAEESVLVVASRGDVALELAVPATARPLYGDARLAASGGGLTVSATGPVFAAWALPGVDVPGA